jgi:phosphoenolpyruvate carboxykinase (GTP)
MAATMGSEATAAAVGQAAMRRDPMAMLPFAGYNMADYWQHWLNMGGKVLHQPHIFRVNWFRKDGYGKFIWPGYGENMRALEWIVNRVHGRAGAMESPLGWVPRAEDMRWEGLQFDQDKFYEIMAVVRGVAHEEAETQKEFFEKFGDRLPKEMWLERELLLSRLARAPEVWDLRATAA